MRYTKIRDALIKNHSTIDACITLQQVGPDHFDRWNAHIKELYKIARKTLLIAIERKCTSVFVIETYMDIYTILWRISISLGRSKRSYVRVDQDVCQKLVCFAITDDLINDNIYDSEKLFRLRVERFFARELMQLNLVDGLFFRDAAIEKELEKKFAELVGGMTTDERINRDDDILYIHNGYIICERANHEIIPVTAMLNNINGDAIEINAFHCLDCKKYFMSYESYRRYRDIYGVILGNLFMSSSGKISDFHFDLLDESRLHLCGYSVNKKENLSDAARQRILAYCMDCAIMTKNDIIHLLDWLIKMNGARLGNSEAVAKWKQDICFVENYRIYDQDRFNVSGIKKYSRNRYKRIVPNKTQISKAESSICVGKRVRHMSSNFGDGVIVSADSRHVSVEFDNGKNAMFVYSAFDMGLLKTI